MLKSYFLPSEHPKGFLRVIADSEQADELKALGFLATEAEAVAASAEQDNAPATGKEIRAKARELGITYGPKSSDESILAKINEKLG